MAAGAFDVDALVDARGPTRRAVEAWLSREHAAHRLLRVADEDSHTWVPSLVLDESGARLATFPEMAEVLRPLRDVGMKDWAAWTWLATPSGWPGEPSPGELLDQRRFDELAARARGFADRSRSTSAAVPT